MKRLPELRSSRESAEASPHTHRLVLGKGYLNLAKEPDIKTPVDAKARKICVPAFNVETGTTHAMRPPGGGLDVIMIWNKGHQAWSSILPFQGNRLAWKADYLSRAGWAYMRPQSLDVKKAG
jgi:hypothetical protein